MTPPEASRPAPVVDCTTETPGGFPHRLRVRTHVFRADAGPASGGADSAPGPHDYFDSALAACKAITVLWYARQKGIPLESVEVRVERDDAEERNGRYVLRVHLDFRGPLDEDQRTKLYGVAAKCPIHKLMTSSEVVIETAPLGPAAA